MPTNAAGEGSGDHRAEDSQPRGLLERAKALLQWDLLEHVKALLGLAALAVYGIVRNGLDAFYGALGIRAEDVGLTQVLIITRAALSFVYVLIVGALLMALVARSLSSAADRLLDAAASSQPEQVGRRPTAERLPSPSTLFYAVAWIGVVTVGLSLFLASLLIRGQFLPWGSSPYLNAAVALAAVVAYAVFAIRPIGRRAVEVYVDAVENPSALAAARVRSFWSLNVVTAIMLTALLVFAVPYASGALIAGDVMDGKPYVPRYLVGLPVVGSLDVRAECVVVKHKDGRVVNASIAPGKILYLGQAEGFLVLYQARGGPLRLPSGDFILSSVSTKTCY